VILSFFISTSFANGFDRSVIWLQTKKDTKKAVVGFRCLSGFLFFCFLFFGFGFGFCSVFCFLFCRWDFVILWEYFFVFSVLFVVVKDRFEL